MPGRNGRQWLPSRISDCIYLGGKECAEDADTLSKIGIQKILSILQDPQGVKVPHGLQHLPLCRESSVQAHDPMHACVLAFFEYCPLL